MDMLEKDWASLPQRKSRRRTALENEETRELTAAERNAEQIAANIADRARANRALSTTTTLQSQDGCPGQFYEYLDHTADVQCHAWGNTLEDAFSHIAQCMLNYMTDATLVKENIAISRILKVSGHDSQSLLYNFLTELLFLFSTDGFCAVRVDINRLDRESFELEAILHGETLDLSRHSSGTEIKAITYSNMQIHERQDRVDLFVIVDI